MKLNWEVNAGAAAAMSEERYAPALHVTTPQGVKRVYVFDQYPYDDPRKATQHACDLVLAVLAVFSHQARVYQIGEDILPDVRMH